MKDIEELNNHDEDEELSTLRERHDLDEDEAEEVLSLMEDEGLDEEDAVEIRNYSGNGSSGGGFGELVGGLVFLALLIWGGSSLWGFVFGGSNSEYSDSSYGQPTSFYDSSEYCSEPENPFAYGSGHYAGWEWGEQGNYCDGNSNSFIEGCEEYDQAQMEYEECLNN